MIYSLNKIYEWNNDFIFVLEIKNNLKIASKSWFCNFVVSKRSQTCRTWETVEVTEAAPNNR